MKAVAFTTESYFYGISAGTDGGVYAAGHIDGNGALVKYNRTDGMEQWTKLISPNRNTDFTGVVAGADGNIYVVGIVSGLINPTSQRVFIGIGFAIPIQASSGILPPLG